MKDLLEIIKYFVGVLIFVLIIGGWDEAESYLACEHLKTFSKIPEDYKWDVYGCYEKQSNGQWRKIINPSVN